MKRTDPHRPGALIAEDYDFVLSYALASTLDGWPVPSQGVSCLDGAHHPSGHCCVVGLSTVAHVAWAATGATGKCSVCGACYVYGDVWAHRPTGEHIHLGHDCAAKYSMVADRADFEATLDGARRTSAAEHLRLIRAETVKSFLDANPGLAAALELDHAILRDMRDRFRKWGDLSEKQVAFALKLADEIRNPPPAEVHVPAPTGRVDFTGVIVGTKLAESDWGTALKLTVKVDTGAGTWLAWMTCPASLTDDVFSQELIGRIGNAASRELGDTAGARLKGATVEFTATLELGRDAHFAFGKRPTARLLTLRDGTVVNTPAPPAKAKKGRKAKAVAA